jgi:hypothetical protein
MKATTLCRINHRCSFGGARSYRVRFLTNQSESGFLVGSGIASYSNSEVFFISLLSVGDRWKVVLKCFFKIETVFLYIL